MKVARSYMICVFRKLFPPLGIKPFKFFAKCRCLVCGIFVVAQSQERNVGFRRPAFFSGLQGRIIYTVGLDDLQVQYRASHDDGDHGNDQYRPVPPLCRLHLGLSLSRQALLLPALLLRLFLLFQRIPARLRLLHAVLIRAKRVKGAGSLFPFSGISQLFRLMIGVGADAFLALLYLFRTVQVPIVLQKCEALDGFLPLSRLLQIQRLEII